MVVIPPTIPPLKSIQELNLAKPFDCKYIEVAVAPAPSVVSALGSIKAQIEAWAKEGKSEEEIGKYGAKYHTGRHEGGRWVKGVDIDIDIKYGKDVQPSDCVVKLYNVNHYGLLKMYGKGSYVSVKAGRLSNYGIIFLGKVQTMSWSRSDNDDVLTLECVEDQTMFLQRVGSQRWIKGTKFTTVIEDMLQLTNVVIGFLDKEVLDECMLQNFALDTDHTFKYWLSELVDRAFHQGVWVNNPNGGGERKQYPMHWFMRQGRFYCMRENLGMPTGLVFNNQTGLMTVEQSRDDKGNTNESKYTIKVLLDWRMFRSSVIQVESNQHIRYYIADDVRFVSNASDHYVEMNCRILKATQDVINSEPILVVPSEDVSLEGDVENEYEYGYDESLFPPEGE
jgi:hypothetical protein